jgi:hypothetical protein
MVREDARVYSGHVSTNSSSCLSKACQMETVLSSRADLASVDLLDVSAGSGHLSAYLNRHSPDVDGPLLARCFAVL